MLVLLCAVAGAVGGMAYYGTDAWRAGGGRHRVAAYLGITLAYIVAAGSVLVGRRDPPPLAVVMCRGLCQYRSPWGNIAG